MNTNFGCFRWQTSSLIVLLLSATWSLAQSVPPGQLRGAAKAQEAAQNPALAVAAGAAPACSQLPKISNFLPLTLKDGDGAEISDETVQCFYQSSGTVSPVNQVAFLYGFGGGDSKTLSADLVSVQFHGGFQATLGSSVTMGTSTTTTQTTTTTSANGQQNQDTKTLTQDTPGTAISKLQAGGDLYLRFDYPILYKNGSRWAGVVYGQPKIGGNFSGFGSEATVTQASEYNINLSVEAYGEWRGIGDAGSLYADLRTGWQYVQPEVAQKLGLGNQNKFGMSQFAAGVEFAGLIRLGFQRFVGPAPAFNVTTSELSKWHLVANLVPKKKK
jgi:hypothetical protein